MMKDSHQIYQNISYQEPQVFSSLNQKYQVNSNKELRDKGLLYQATVDKWEK